LLDDITIISRIINDSKYKSLTNDQKETFIFDGIIFYYNLLGTGEKLVDYIIFDYKISENNSIDKIDVDKEIIELFKIRQLKEELGKELAVKEIISNKVKI
jgi:hypothetical protein